MQVTVDQLKEIFGEKGEVTDVQLKYTKDGKFRNFGFIGYRSEEQAAAATEYFDGTCIRSMKIQVQPCANLGDEKKPRAWSKYASDSTAYKNLHKDEIEEQEKQKKKEKNDRKVEKNRNKIKDLLKKVCLHWFSLINFKALLKQKKHMLCIPILKNFPFSICRE